MNLSSPAPPPSHSLRPQLHPPATSASYRRRPTSHRCWSAAKKGSTMCVCYKLARAPEMEKSATSVGVIGRLGGLYDDARLRSSSSSDEVNGPCSYGAAVEQTNQIWAQSPRNMTDAEKIKFRAKYFWPNTFRLDCTALGEPIGPVTREYICEARLVRPMQQRVPDTCAIVACTVCMDAVHRKHHGVGCTCRALEPSDLLEACQIDGIWMPGKGAYTANVLEEIRVMGGVPAATNGPTPAPCVLPLRSFQEYWCEADGLSQECVAELLDKHAPCVGALWVCPWYHFFDADRDDTLVYRGCGRSEDNRKRSKELYPGQVGSHAVVCLGYRFCGDQMHVLVLDNHSANGPRRWIHVEELRRLYTLNVGPCSCT